MVRLCWRQTTKDIYRMNGNEYMNAIMIIFIVFLMIALVSIVGVAIILR